MRGAVRAWIVLLATAWAVLALADDQATLKRVLNRLGSDRRELDGYMQKNATLQGHFRPRRDHDERLAQALERFQKTRTKPLAYYHNISGAYSGTFSVHNQSHVNTSQRAERGDLLWWDRVPKTAMSLTQEPLANASVAKIWGEVSLRALSFSGELTMTEWDVVGVHALKTGQLFLVGVPTTSPIVLDMRYVMPLVPEDLRNDTYTAVVAELDQRAERLRSMLANHELLTPPDTFGQSSNNCTVQIHGQMHGVGSVHEQSTVDLIEHELEAPRGIVVPRAPALVVDLAVLSTRCGIYADLPALEGMPRAQFWADARFYVLGMALVLLAQLILMSKECGRLQTHSDIARLSTRSWLIQTNADAFLCMGHLMLGFTLPGPLALAMLALGFMAGTLFMVFEYRILSSIMRQNAEEQDLRPHRAQTAAAMDTDATPSVLRRARAALQDVGVAVRDTLPSMILITVLVLSFAAPTLLGYLLVPVLFSFWLPQIIHNARRNSSGLHPSTIVGMTLTRCYLPLYLFQYKHNLFALERSPWIWALVVWMLLQMGVLVGQHYWSPKFFLPSAWRRDSHAWNWHPTPEALAELLATSEEHGAGTDEEAPLLDPSALPLGDCPICLTPNDWAIDESWEPPARAWRAWTKPATHRSGLMVTPWMDIKQVCPSCRLPLPVYDT